MSGAEVKATGTARWMGRGLTRVQSASALLCKDDYRTDFTAYKKNIFFPSPNRDFVITVESHQLCQEHVGEHKGGSAQISPCPPAAAAAAAGSDRNYVLMCLWRYMI